MTRGRLLSIVAFLSLALSAVAHAQAGRGLDDPTGATPPRARPTRTTGDAAIPPPPPGTSATPVPAPPGSVDAADAVTLTRLRALDASLQALAASSGPDYLRGILSLIGGGAGVAFGIVAAESGDATLIEMAPFFIALGGTTLVRTILVDFILPPNAQPAALEYQTMPSATAAQRRARLEYGERELAGLAERWMITRVVDGSVNIAGAAAATLLYLGYKEWMLRSEFEALLFIGPAIAVIGGIITLATPSSAERRWDAYRQMRERLGAQAALDALPPPPATTLNLNVAAAPEGGMALLHGTF